MKPYNRYLILFMGIWLLPVFSVLAQNTPVSGRITDASGAKIEGAKVMLKENPDVWTRSGSDGTFSIAAEVGQHLKIIREDRTVKVVPIREPNVSIRLDGISKVPLGYGIARDQEELTAATSTVMGRQLEQSYVINPTNALYGELPGLTILGNGGLPPTGTGQYIRGRGTFTNSSPLILVDGFERPLPSLITAEIKSVTVLKDAAALAKYGQRGANGVVLVKTKRGQKGDISVTASYETALTEPTALPSFTDAPVYARALNEALLNDGQRLRYGSADISAFDAGNSPYLYPNVDWFDQTLRDYGTRSRFKSTFEGGLSNIRYFAAISYLGENGLFGPVSRNEDYSTQAKYSRFHFRTNLDIDVTDNLLLKLDVSGNLNENNLPSGGGGAGQMFNTMYSIPSAAFPVKNPDGSWGGTQIYDNNPMAVLTSTGFGQPNAREFFLTGELEQDLDQWIKGLGAEVAVSYHNYGSFFERKSKKFSYKALNPVRNEAGNIIDTTYTKYGQSTDLNFIDSFGNERTFFDLLGKVNYDIEFENSSLSTRLLFHQSSRIYDGPDNVNRRQNFAGMVHYSLMDKYFFDISASYSGNNWMPPSDRFGFFPAVSAGWLLSSEDFLDGVKFLDKLKLRASWGITGSDRLPKDNVYEQIYPAGDNNPNNDDVPGYWFQPGNNYEGGFEEGRLAANNFTFETSYKTNVGIDIGLFEKLDLTADVFYERRTNILTGAGGSLSEVIGIRAPLESNGEVVNQGIEAGLNWQHNIGNVSYYLGGQVSFARNEIVEMNETYRPYDYLKRTGRQIGQRFGMEAIGFFEDEADIANSPRQVFSEVEPGDIKYKDQNGDGIINEFDEVPLGHSSGYPEIYYSISLGGSYKGFSVSALLQGTGNYTAYLNTKSVFWPLMNNNTISNYYYNRRWTPQTSASASYPRLTTESNNNNFRPNSIWLKDRSYLKLRTVEVSYQLPASIVKPLHLRKIRIYGQGRNLFSIDNIPVLDPENLSAGYPILRTYNIGLEISF